MNLLVTGAARPTEQQLNRLRVAGHTVWFLAQERDPLPDDPSRFDGVIANGLFLHHDIATFSSLKYLQVTSAGLDRLPLSYIQAHNITLRNAAGVYSIPMAEFVLAAVLQQYKQLTFFRDNQSAHRWEKHRSITELCGKRLCLVGCGNVASACAVRFAALGCEVVGVDVAPREDPLYTTIYPVTALCDAVKTADVVVLTLPLTDATRHLINTKVLSCFKEGSLLVNIARGPVVDTAALLTALDTRSLYAVLDVFEEEPLSEESPLWDHPRVTLTPHNSFVSENNDDRLWNCIHANLLSFTEGTI